ncbi:MAG: 4-hydroxyphenylacetate 3-hydroxylase N-terminal domain-containing protein [Methanobacteriota archaeon]
MKTPEQYRESLREMRPNVHKFGELIKDVTTHPATRRAVSGHAQIYAAQHDSQHRDVVTKVSSFSGERVSRYLTLIENMEDMWANSRMKRLMFNLTGTCTGGRCVGWNSVNATWATAWEIDKERGTKYHENLKNWLIEAQKRDISVCGALTDPKGDRSLPPHKQKDPDMNLRVVETSDDGITVRGAKVQIAGAAASHEIFVLPGSGYKVDDKDYSVSFVTPKDEKGITIIEARHPSDGRDFEDGWDNPVKCGGITQGYVFFEDVFVPRERVFMNGEWEWTMKNIMSFISPYRSAIGGCVAGQGDLMVGASALLARANGLNEKAFGDKLNKMTINNETTFAVGIAAAACGKKHPSGVWTCDPLLANVNKVHVATLPYETKRLAQEIGGGIAETGCMPSWKDLESPEHGGLVKKYLKANSTAETRVKLARLIEWLTIGSGVPGTMHGGGSPDGAGMVIRANSDIEEKMKLVRRLIEIDEGTKVEK